MAFLSFLSPWLLAGLLILPGIWWLLKVTPPIPKNISFPPTWILKGLVSTKKSPAHTPLWLLLLRMAIAALVILALSGPVLNGDNTGLPGSGSVVLIVDNGWSSGQDWTPRKEKLLSLVSRAQQEGRTVLVLPTVNPVQGLQKQALKILSANDAMRYAASLVPHPVKPERGTVLAGLKPFLEKHRQAGIIWLSDGLDHRAATDTGELPFAQQLASTVQANHIQVILPETTRHPLGLFAQNTDKGQLQAVILSSGQDNRTGYILALNTRGQALGEKPFTLKKGEYRQTVSFEMPLELRNQVARLEVRQASHAGGRLPSGCCGTMAAGRAGQRRIHRYIPAPALPCLLYRKGYQELFRDPAQRQPE